MIPYGVYDLAANEALVYLAQGADTGELACDAIRRWWYRLGKWRYDATSPILLLADCGGSNGYRVPLFRQQLYQLSQLLGRTFRVCHLPPYCSKYNPIDHRLFCHLSRSLQAIQLTSIEAIYKRLFLARSVASSVMKARGRPKKGLAGGGKRLPKVCENWSRTSRTLCRPNQCVAGDSEAKNRILNWRSIFD